VLQTTHNEWRRGEGGYSRSKSGWRKRGKKNYDSSFCNQMELAASMGPSPAGPTREAPGKCLAVGRGVWLTWKWLKHLAESECRRTERVQGETHSTPQGRTDLDSLKHSASMVPKVLVPRRTKLRTATLAAIRGHVACPRAQNPLHQCKSGFQNGHTEWERGQGELPTAAARQRLPGI
jgi:hypothetical protein